MVTTLPCCTCFMIILRSRVYSLVYLFTLLFLQIHVRNNQNLKLVLHLRDARGRLFDNFTSLSVSWSSSNSSLARFPDLSKSVNMMFLRVKEDENVQRSVCKYRGHFSNSLVEKKLWILVSLIIFSPSVSKKNILIVRNSSGNFGPGSCKPCGSFIHVAGFSDLVDLWVIKIKKAYDPLRT